MVCRAGETENKLSREWKLEKKNENMIKSVSQRLLAFSRYTERGVGNREPTGDFCRPSETSSSHTLAYRVELCRDLKRMHQEKHTGTQKQTRQIDTNIVLCCVPPCMALCLRGSDIPNTKLHEITAHDTGLPHQLWLLTGLGCFQWNLESKYTFFSSSEPQAFQSLQRCLVKSRYEAQRDGFLQKRKRRSAI